jgi:phosphate transport system substrate-binding protein
VTWWLADLAMDGVAVIVNPQNPINEISLQDARAIFSGERNNWVDYGADSIGNIEVAVREAGDGTRLIFDQTIMGDLRLTFDAMVMPSAETMLNYVAIKPGAIGYVPSASVARKQPAVKVLTLSGAAPQAENITDGGYPLSRMLNLIAAREPQGELRNFVAWALGPQGQQIAQSLGYAALK